MNKGTNWTKKEEEILKRIWPQTSGGLNERSHQIIRSEALIRHTWAGIAKKAATLGLWEQTHYKTDDELSFKPSGKSECDHRPLHCLIELVDKYHNDATLTQDGWANFIKRCYATVDVVYQDLDAARKEYGRFRQRLDDPAYQHWIAERLQKEQDELDLRIKQDMIVDHELKDSGRY